MDSGDKRNSRGITVKRRLTDLTQCWLYAIASPTDLARRLSTKETRFSVEDLRALGSDKENFRQFEILTEDGFRAIQEPKRRLQWIHARVHKLLARVEVPPYLHSAIRGRSYITNACAHSADTEVFKVDVKKFYRSVPRSAVYNFFLKEMACRSDVAGLLAELLTFNGFLPTGSSASPIISFYSFKPMFDEIQRLAEGKGLTFTCYVDDMTFSGNLATRSTLYEVRKVITKHGLKSHKARVFSPTQPKIITGVCKASDGHRVPNKLHLDIKRGFNLLSMAASEATRQQFLTPLLGKLHAAGQIDPAFKARARSLRNQTSSPLNPQVALETLGSEQGEPLQKS